MTALSLLLAVSVGCQGDPTATGTESTTESATTGQSSTGDSETSGDPETEGTEGPNTTGPTAERFPFILDVLPVPGPNGTPFDPDFTGLSLSVGLFYRTHDGHDYQESDYDGPSPSYGSLDLGDEALEGHGGRDLRSPLVQRLEVYAVDDGVVCNVDGGSDGEVIVAHMGRVVPAGTTIGGFEVGGTSYSKSVEGILFTAYIHLDSPTIPLGTEVSAGEPIGERSAEGEYGENLHFEAFFLTAERAGLEEDANGVWECSSTKSSPDDPEGYEDPELEENDKAHRFPPILLYGGGTTTDAGHAVTVETTIESDNPVCPLEIVLDRRFSVSKVDAEAIAIEVRQDGLLRRGAALLNLAPRGHRHGYSPKTNDISPGRPVGLPLEGEALEEAKATVMAYPYPPDYGPSAEVKATSYSERMSLCVLDPLGPGDYEVLAISQDLSGNRAEDTRPFTLTK